MFPVKLTDTSCERKTAEIVLRHVRSEFTRTEKDWEVKLAALVSDNSGESRAMRRMLRIERPDLIILQCYAHQNNLIVGDLMKACAELFFGIFGDADTVIQWFRSKTFVLALLRTAQEEQGVSCPLSIIRAVITRWISHYLSYRRLLELRDFIMHIISQDRLRLRAGKESQLVTGNADAKAKANKVLAILDKPTFWYRLTRCGVKTYPSPDIH